MTTDHAHLRALAKAATPGHWGFAIKEECTASTNHEPIAYWLNAPRNFYYDKSLFIRHNDARFIAEASPSTIIDLLDTIERLTADGLRLRRLLCVATAKHPYMDDGEASDCSIVPFIDYLRETPQDIETKIALRNIAAIAKEKP